MNSYPKFYLTHLYPKEMSIYGDMGNIIALQYRLERYGFEVVYQEVNQGQNLPKNTDIYFIGGGQDKEQEIIFKDLETKKERLISDVEEGVPVLAICGGYQLLGKKFLTGEGLEIDGIGIFDVETKAPDASVKSRCIGNIIVKSMISGLLDDYFVGFENHSGQTHFLSYDKCKPLGKVLLGFGNNSSRVYEGCIYKNAIGTYMHGSCLPKNPELANFLIFKAIRNKAEKEEIDPQFYLDLKKAEFNDDISQETKKQLIQRLLPNN